MPRRTIQAAALAVLALCVAWSGCRKKDNPVTPPDGPGEWRLTLHSPDTLYRDAPGGHVLNETITVRLFDTTGVLASNVAILARCAVSVDSVSPSVSSRRDTVTYPWGCDPQMVYWGSGGAAGRDTVTGWAVVQGETVATAATWFKVMDPLSAP